MLLRRRLMMVLKNEPPIPYGVWMLDIYGNIYPAGTSRMTDFQGIAVCLPELDQPRIFLGDIGDSVNWAKSGHTGYINGVLKSSSYEVAKYDYDGKGNTAKALAQEGGSLPAIDYIASLNPKGTFFPRSVLRSGDLYMPALGELAVLRYTSLAGGVDSSSNSLITDFTKILNTHSNTGPSIHRFTSTHSDNGVVWCVTPVDFNSSNRIDVSTRNKYAGLFGTKSFCLHCCLWEDFAKYL